MLNKLNKLKLVSIASVALAASGFALAVSASDDGKDDGKDGYDYKIAYQGCTPGYWKQPHHADSWYYGYSGYTPYTPVKQVFYGYYGPYLTLADALKLKGGKENALLRHGVAALLNADNAYVTYYYTVDEVKYKVDEALKSYKKKMIEKTKDDLEEWNEQGCPLN